MCITFFHMSNDSASDVPYRLILIANRDEFYHRKSRASNYWDDNPEILGGLDVSVEPQGTWLAASKKGKIGVLLNIEEKMNGSHEVESRGGLIPDFLKQDIRSEAYFQNVLHGTKVYNGYHLLLFTLKAELIQLRMLTYLEYGRRIEINEMNSGNHGVSNSPVSTPYQKVLFGKEKFEQIVKKYNTMEEKEKLVAELKNLLRSQVLNYPDDVLDESKKGIMPFPQIKKLSSIFVTIPEQEYGTRTHTIILIDWNNKMEYWEYTMSDGHDNVVDQWNYNKFEVQLDIENE